MGALETFNVNRPLAATTPVRAATLTLVVLLSGCSAMENFLGGDSKLDYRSNAQKTAPLEVPPDLTQLQREGRYQPQAGVVNASNYQGSAAAAPAAAAATTASVAPQAVGNVRLERQGDMRWLVTSQTPEQVWPQLRSFWQGLGLAVGLDAPETGVMETEWAENRAKLPQDIVRNVIGRVFDSVYSTGERDKFRTRVERGANGTEIFISHRGLQEVIDDKLAGSTKWQFRPADPLLEAELLARLMVKLGAQEQQARAAVGVPAAANNASTASPSATPAVPQGPARARLVAGQPATLQVDEPFDRAWRRVGLALDRTGFTVEDRDRANGVYYVRYVDPKVAAQEEPGFFSRIFGRGKDTDNAPVRYRVAVQRGQTEQTTVTVQNAQGQAETGDVGRQITGLLLEDLK